MKIIHNKLITAASELLRYAKDCPPPPNDAIQNIINQYRKKLGFDFYELDEQGKRIADPIKEAVEKAVKDIENTCCPAIEARHKKKIRDIGKYDKHASTD